jgi:exosome complex component RRP4
MASIDIRTASSRVSDKVCLTGEPENLMIPGDLITTDTNYMRGHGTYTEDDKLLSSVAGVVQRVNKLISVKSLKSRYIGDVGDVVVGRVIELGQKRWKVDTKSRLDSILMLSSVNLPGGVLRRRSEEDERMMREYLDSGDLISAEVQSIFSDGSLSLHTRSLKYGKLGQGVLVEVSPSLVQRRKTHFHNLACGASVILGNNGYIWICPTVCAEQDIATGGYEQSLELVSKSERDVIARLKNCIEAMSECHMLLYDTSILYTYEASSQYSTKDILKTEIMREIVELARQRLEQES